MFDIPSAYALSLSACALCLCLCVCVCVWGGGGCEHVSVILFVFWKDVPQWNTMDTQIKVPSVENPELTNVSH